MQVEQKSLWFEVSTQNKKFKSVMWEQDYTKTTTDHCVFVQKFSDADDMLIIGRNASRIDGLKK